MNSVFSTQHTWSPGLPFRPSLKPLTSTQSSFVHHLWIIWPIYMSWFIPNLYRKPSLSSSSDRVYGAEQHSERSSSLPLIWRKQNKRRHIRVCQHASGQQIRAELWIVNVWEKLWTIRERMFSAGTCERQMCRTAFLSWMPLFHQQEEGNKGVRGRRWAELSPRLTSVDTWYGAKVKGKGKHGSGDLNRVWWHCLTRGRGGGGETRLSTGIKALISAQFSKVSFSADWHFQHLRGSLSKINAH